MADKKMAFYVTEEQLAEIEELKRTEYYNKPYSELLRDIINAGLKAKKEGE